MTRKVGVVGSRTFPLSTAVATEIVDMIRGFGDDTAILLRGTQGVEEFIAHAALILGLRCFRYPGGGGASNYLRDDELARDADELIAFLDPDALDAKSGTAHVLERALAHKRPVRVATVVNEMLVWAESPLVESA